MKTMRLLALALTFLTVNVALAADEIHWTVTGPNSVTFDWRGTAAENTIGYGLTSGAYTTVTATTPTPVPVSSSGPFWEAKLTGLAANTRYYYKIGAMPEKTFRTQPTLGSSNFHIYAQGNIGSSSTYFNTGAVQDIIANDLPSFVVGLGDLTLGSIDGRAAVDQHFKDVMVWSKEAAYMPVWGDMDTVSSDHESFKNYKGRFDLSNPQTSSGSPLAGGEDWYWFDYGNIRFITLPEPWTDAWADWNTKAGALMASAQANSNIKFIVTFSHQPAYSSGSYTGLSTLKGILDKLGDTYSKYRLNINAHSNNYERTVPQHGVTHVTAGTGGADLVQDGTCLWKTCAKPDWSAFRAMHLGALKLRFTAAGIEGSFICGPAGGGVNDVNCTEGSVVDKFVIGGPVISAVSAFNISQTNAQITWTLNEPATGQVEYGKTTSYGQLSTKQTSFNYSTHIQWIWNLVPSTQYHFRVRSTNQAGLESVSGDFTFTTPDVADTIAPSVPASLNATANSSSQVTLSWAASTDNVAVTGYKVFRNGSQIATVTGTSYSNTGLTASTTYTYTVSAYDAAGNNGAQSASVTVKTPPVPDTIAPSVPASLNATVNSSSQITLSWAASIDNVAVAGYKVFRGGAQIATVSGTSFSNTGLAASTTYSYTVSAYDAAGNNSAQSMSVSAKTLSATPPVIASYYVSPSGSDSNPGTISAPFLTIQKAVNVAVSGNTILVRGGTYRNALNINKSGIKLWNYPNEIPIIYGVQVTFSANSTHFKGFEISHSPARGLSWSGNNNIFELLNVHHSGQNNSAGWGIIGSGSGNLILNCDSHDNSDTTPGQPGQNSDGITLADSTGTGNIIRGNRVWNNGDDGFDLWHSQNITLENNWSWHNGYLPTGAASYGSGMGYKIGGTGYKTPTIVVGNHKIINSIAWGNKNSGFDDNSSTAVASQVRADTFYNCTSAQNGTNFSFGSPAAHVFRNNVSYGALGYIGSTSSKTYNSWTISGVSVTSADFMSVDYTQMARPRKADGSLPDITFLHLVSGSDLINKGTNVGLPYTGTAPDLGAFEYGASTPSTPSTAKIYLIGDSTVAAFPSSRAPLQGWGPALATALGSRASITNLALSGASTSSYISGTNGNWSSALASFRSGDYVFIQLGHNDEVSITAAQFKTNITKFVTETKAKGAIPVLVTSVTRRNFDAQGHIVDNHPFVPVIYEIATAQQVPVIRLYETSKTLVESAGVVGSKAIYLYTTAGQYPAYPNGISDDTHFQGTGASQVSKLVVSEITRLHLAGF